MRHIGALSRRLSAGWMAYSLAILFALTLASVPTRAQSVPSSLAGVFVGGNSIVNENPISLAAALKVPGVDGFLLNIGWADIEPTMGQYDWTTMDAWLATASVVPERCVERK